MSSRYEVKFDGIMVTVHLQGAENIEVASRLWPDVVRTCELHNCFKVLGVADTTDELGVVDSLSHVELFKRLGIDERYRIAWVELNSHAYDATSFTEGVLSNRGLPGRLFASVERAYDWLIQA